MIERGRKEVREAFKEERAALEEERAALVVSYRTILFDLLKHRFGKITVKSRRTIEKTVDNDLLERVRSVALKCNDSKEFERKLLELVAN